jgi:hypothetical protein
VLFDRRFHRRESGLFSIMRITTYQLDSWLQKRAEKLTAKYNGSPEPDSPSYQLGILLAVTTNIINDPLGFGPTLAEIASEPKEPENEN